MLTSGAMTNRLDRLENDGLVRRDRNPDDRRGVHVVLTDKGRELADRAIRIRFDEATGAAAVLDDQEQKKVAALLAKLLLSLEQDGPGAP